MPVRCVKFSVSWLLLLCLVILYEVRDGRFLLIICISSARQSILAMPPKSKRTRLTQRKGERRKADLKRQDQAETPDSAAVQSTTADDQQATEDHATVTGKKLLPTTHCHVYACSIWQVATISAVCYWMCVLLASHFRPCYTTKVHQPPFCDHKSVTVPCFCVSEQQ